MLEVSRRLVHDSPTLTRRPRKSTTVGDDR
jgi:hypothetical protein